MTLTSSSSSISTFDSALMGDMQKVIVVMMKKFCFLHLVQKYAGHILIRVNSDLKEDVVICTLKTRWRYKNDQTRSNIFELVGFDVQSGLNSEQWIVWFEQLIWNIFDILIFLNISNIFIGNILELVGFDVQSGLNSEQSGLNSSYGNILLLLAEDNLSIKDKVKSVRLQGYL